MDPYVCRFFSIEILKLDVYIRVWRLISKIKKIHVHVYVKSLVEVFLLP